MSDPGTAERIAEKYSPKPIPAETALAAELRALQLNLSRAEDRLSASGSNADLFKALRAREDFEQACAKHGEALLAELAEAQAKVTQLRAVLTSLAVDHCGCPWCVATAESVRDAVEPGR